MTTSYLLPCSCGQKVRVEPRQAGEVVTCSCGVSLEAPTMLQMAALEMADSEPESPRPPKVWGVRQSLSLLGAALFLTALGLAALNLYDRPPPPAFGRPGMPPEAIRRQSRSLTPFESRRAWQTLRAQGPDGLTPAQEQRYADILDRYGEALLRWRLWMGVVLIIAVVGGGLVVIPLLSGTHL